MIHRIYIMFFTIIWINLLSCSSDAKKVETSLIPDSVKLVYSQHERAAIHSVRDHPTLDTFVIGNFDKDRIKDTAFSYGPMDSTHFDMFDCWPCKSYITFSNGSKGFEREQDIGSYIENVGDLDKDGIDEIGRYSCWFTGGWSTIMILKNVNGEWKWAGYSKVMLGNGPFKINSLIKNLGNGKILMYGEHPIFSEQTETVFDLKADTLPCLVSEKKFEE